MAWQWKQNRRNGRRTAGLAYMSRKQRRAYKFNEPKGAKQAGSGSTRNDHK